jgi:toxin FitB
VGHAEILRCAACSRAFAVNASNDYDDNQGMTFSEDFAGRILPFDTAAATAYVDIVSARRAAGRPISQFDAQIAAIARHAGAKLATRNVNDFDLCGVSMVNPWIALAG